MRRVSLHRCVVNSTLSSSGNPARNLKSGFQAPLRNEAGARGEGRTLNLRLRRPTLYPIELLAQNDTTIDQSDLGGKLGVSVFRCFGWDDPKTEALKHRNTASERLAAPQSSRGTAGRGKKEGRPRPSLSQKLLRTRRLGRLFGFLLAAAFFHLLVHVLILLELIRREDLLHFLVLGFQDDLELLPLLLLIEGGVAE